MKQQLHLASKSYIIPSLYKLIERRLLQDSPSYSEKENETRSIADSSWAWRSTYERGGFLVPRFSLLETTGNEVFFVFVFVFDNNINFIILNRYNYTLIVYYFVYIFLSGLDAICSIKSNNNNNYITMHITKHSLSTVVTKDTFLISFLYYNVILCSLNLLV